MRVRTVESHLSIPLEDVTYVTTSPQRRKLLSESGIPENHYSNRRLDNLISTAETEMDEKLGIHLFTEIPSYPFYAAFAKGLAIIKYRNSQNGNELNNGRKFEDSELLASADSTWVVGGQYVNKPKSHPEGSISGVRAVYAKLIENAGLPARNESVLILGTKKGIERAFLFNLEIGKVREDIGSHERKKEVLGILTSGRNSVSAGIDSSEGASRHIYEHNGSIPLTTFKIGLPLILSSEEFYDTLIQDEDGLSRAIHQINPEELISGLEIRKIAERKIPSSNLNEIMAAILATFPADYKFSI